MNSTRNNTNPDSSTDPVLSVRNLQTVFRTDRELIRAVDGISFDINKGETLGIVGESGSGKSVTARSIMGLIDAPGDVRPESSIKFNGEELTAYTDTEYQQIRGSGIGMVFQDPLKSLNPVYTVGYEEFEHHIQRATPQSPRAITTVARVPGDGAGGDGADGESASSVPDADPSAPDAE